MKKLSCAVLGYGNRGEIYAKYANACPNELSVIAAIILNGEKSARISGKTGAAEIFYGAYDS